MINTERFIGGSIGTAISAIGIDITNLQSVQSIVAIVCTVLGAVLTLISSLIIPLIKWYKEAKKDNKITVEELDEAKKIIDNFTEEKDKDDAEKH